MKVNTSLYIFFIASALMFTSCLSTRSTNKERDKIKFIETAHIESKAPGDRVYIEFPRTPDERPKSTTKSYNGESGARVDVLFDNKGQINTVLADCPEVDKKEERSLEFERDLRLKQTERTFNMELAKEIKSGVIWIAGIFAIAWIIRGIKITI